MDWYRSSQPLIESASMHEDSRRSESSFGHRGGFVASARIHRLGELMLKLTLVCIVALCPLGCIQDEVVVSVAFLKGQIVPVGISPVTTTTTSGSVIITVNTTVPTVGVRLNTVGSGTNVSLINPIGPLPGSSEYAFATVTGDWTLNTTRLGHRRVVARGIYYDVGWGDFYPDAFNSEFLSVNLNSVTIPLDSPLRTVADNHLLVKAPGRAAFVLFAEDFTIGSTPVKSVRLILDKFDNAAVGYNVPDDGSQDAQTDHPPDTYSGDLSGGDGIFTRVLTGLTAGEHQYGFVINNDGTIRRDPYEEKAADDHSVLIVP